MNIKHWLYYSTLLSDLSSGHVLKLDDKSIYTQSFGILSDAVSHLYFKLMFG